MRGAPGREVIKQLFVEFFYKPRTPRHHIENELLQKRASEIRIEAPADLSGFLQTLHYRLRLPKTSRTTADYVALLKKEPTCDEVINFAWQSAEDAHKVRRTQGHRRRIPA